MPPRIICRQLSSPTGLLGRFVRRMMNWHNAKMNRFAVEQLELQPADHVLEIGFGGGITLPALISRAPFLGAIDRSPDVVKWAKKKFSGSIKAGRAEFREGSVEAIPFDAAACDKVCTVNTIYFWRSLDAGFAEIQRVLTPGGRVVVAFLPKEWMDRLEYPPDIFTSRAPNDVTAALITIGFKEVRVERPKPTTPWNVIVATR
jgi:arsenite methyltransferase